MRIILFYHSLVSDWNHGNAHFLRGVVTELMSRGHAVEVWEPRDAWSKASLVADHGRAPLDAFSRAYPHLESHEYELDTLDLDRVLDDADLVIVHEWNDPSLVRRIGDCRARTDRFRLLFHDTHHRSVSAPDEMRRYDLTDYDGVLAFGDVIREIYLEQGWTERAWTWHEAADARVFRPIITDEVPSGDLVWIGNWGDDERTEELHEFLIEPARDLELEALIHGVRYPDEALRALEEAEIEYGGWLPNFYVPQTFARYRMTVHVPRRFYVESLPGIPTIRPFEALACGIPLICSPWDDAENLFRAGRDYLMARNGEEMRRHMRAVLEDHEMVRELVRNGRETILEGHTCAHRVDELMRIAEVIGVPNAPMPSYRPEELAETESESSNIVMNDSEVV